MPQPVSGPSLEALLEVAETAWKNEAWGDALGLYKKALMLAPASNRALCASIYMRFGDVKRREGKSREAEFNFEKVLEADKTHRSAHEALVALSEEVGDFRRVVALRKRMRTALSDPSQLLLVADVLEGKLDDAEGAMTVLEEAHAALPDDREVLARLLRSCEAKGRWTKLFELQGALARAANDPKERGELRFKQADVALGRLRDEERGIPALEACLDDDPMHEKALSALVAVRSRRKEWSLLEKAYTKLLD